jgi:hypothetical protein
MERGEGGARWPTVCLSMYSITENIYYSQLSSVAILLQPEPNCFTSYSTSKGLCSLALCAIVLQSPPLPPTCLLVTVNEARSYFASTTARRRRDFLSSRRGSSSFEVTLHKPCTTCYFTGLISRISFPFL